jgi:hypothetical protein
LTLNGDLGRPLLRRTNKKENAPNATWSVTIPGRVRHLPSRSSLGDHAFRVDSKSMPTRTTTAGPAITAPIWIGPA